MSDPTPTRPAYWIEWHDKQGRRGVWSGPFLEKSVAREQRFTCQKIAGAEYDFCVVEQWYTEEQFPPLFHAEQALITDAGVIATTHMKADHTGLCCQCGTATPYIDLCYEAWLCPGECTVKMDAAFNAA